MYEYNAEVVRVVDGDTVDLRVDVGFKCSFNDRFRLEGIDAPESRTRDLIEKKAGLAAKDFLSDYLPVGRTITVKTGKPGKYGRWIATLYRDGVNVNQLMVKEGHARPYDGGKRA